MPLGIVLIDWDQLKGPVIKTKYPEFDFKSSLSDLSMQTFMIHSGKVPPETDISFQLEGTNIASHFFQFKEKDVLRRVMILLILNPEESSKEFFPFLKKVEGDIRGELNNPYLSEIVKSSYNKMISARKFVYSEEKIKEKISNKAKILLDKGEFEAAQKLLAKASAIPGKLSSTLMTAERLLKQKNHVLAADNYEKAAELLDEIGDTDLSSQFKNKAADLKTIPKLENDLRNYVDRVDKAIRKNDFKQAIENTKKCIEVTEKLQKFPTIAELFTIRKTEYTQKMDALQKYIDAEEKAKKEVIELIAKEKLKKPEPKKVTEPPKKKEAERKEPEKKEFSEDVELEVVKDDEDESKFSLP
ncbi:MAG: hypothetical protein ACFFDN_35400 [Candidatus Hodarchaeota archaeon]